MSEWQPIRTAPKEGPPVLGFVPNLYVKGASPFGGEKGFAIIEWYDLGDRKGGEWVTHDSDTCGEPTHWQPLPEPPDNPAEACK
jgi:hypothetical protein